MKLATALKRKKDLSSQLTQLVSRIRESAYTPEDNPEKMVAMLKAGREELARLTLAIDETNHTVTLNAHRTLYEVRVERDMLVQLSKELTSLADTAPTKVAYNNLEMKVTMKNMLDRDAIRAQADQFAKQARELDEALQSANWMIDVLDK